MDAKTWNCRPSDLLAITDEYVAFCVDQAIGYFGRVVEAELEAVEGKTDTERSQKRDRVLQRYIGENDDEKPRRGQFADPTAMF